MSASDLVSAAVRHPSKNAAKFSRMVQQIPLDIQVVGDHRRQNKSPLPTGMSFIVSHQPLSSSPAAGLYVLSGDYSHGVVTGLFGYVGVPSLIGIERVPATATSSPESK